MTRRVDVVPRLLPKLSAPKPPPPPPSKGKP